jgi:hypothetical protein
MIYLKIIWRVVILDRLIMVADYIQEFYLFDFHKLVIDREIL